MLLLAFLLPVQLVGARGGRAHPRPAELERVREALGRDAQDGEQDEQVDERGKWLHGAPPEPGQFPTNIRAGARVR